MWCYFSIQKHNLHDRMCKTCGDCIQRSAVPRLFSIHCFVLFFYVPQWRTCFCLVQLPMVYFVWCVISSHNIRAICNAFTFTYTTAGQLNLQQRRASFSFNVLFSIYFSHTHVYINYSRKVVECKCKTNAEQRNVCCVNANSTVCEGAARLLVQTPFTVEI